MGILGEGRRHNKRDKKLKIREITATKCKLNLTLLKFPKLKIIRRLMRISGERRRRNRGDKMFQSVQEQPKCLQHAAC